MRYSGRASFPVVCSAMQALGAYGFLSVVKGKKYFLKHIPEALRLLKEESDAVKNDYPELCKLVNNMFQ